MNKINQLFRPERLLFERRSHLCTLTAKRTNRKLSMLKTVGQYLGQYWNKKRSAISEHIPIFLIPQNNMLTIIFN